MHKTGRYLHGSIRSSRHVCRCPQMPSLQSKRCLNIHIQKSYPGRPETHLTESYIHNASSIPYLSTTLGRLLDHQADKIGDRVGYVFPHQNVRKTYHDFRQDVDVLANGLLALNLQPGDRIGMWGPNIYEWIVTMFAASKAGLILVNINPAYQVHELEYCLNKVQVKAVVAAEGVATLKYYDHFTQLVPELAQSNPFKLKAKRLPHLQHIVMITDRPKDFPGTLSYSELQSMATEDRKTMLEKLNKEGQSDDAFNIQFTSGTTGSPKGATLSYFGLMNAAYYSGQRLSAGFQTVSLACPLPLYHVFGCVGNLVLSTIYGLKVVFPSAKFDAEAVVRGIQEEKVQCLSGVPTMWRDMLDLPNLKSYDLSSLRYGLMGGAPCPVELITEIQEKIGIQHFTCGYGSTEQSLSTYVGFLGDPPEVYTTTTGYPLDHVEAKVVDEQGRTVPVGQTGELLTRSFGTMLGYWGDEEKSRQTIRPDRWMHSGDLATMTVEGNLKIVGRVKDMIIRGGENVYPVEIENVLLKCELVADAHVCGVPDKRMGEEICAWIRLHTGETEPENRQILEDQMRAFCEKHMARYKTPRYFLFFKTMDSIPMTVTGKIKKFKLSERAIVKLGLQDGKSEHKPSPASIKKPSVADDGHDVEKMKVRA